MKLYFPLDATRGAKVSPGKSKNQKLGLLVVAALILFLAVSGCAKSKELCFKENGRTICERIEPYGLFDSEKQIKNVKYSVSWGNVALGVILCETVIAPVIIFGWYLFEPEYSW